MSNLDDALEKAHALLDIPGVTGVAPGKTGEGDCILVFVTMLTPELVAKVPPAILGVPTRIEVVGVVSAQ